MMVAVLEFKVTCCFPAVDSCFVFSFLPVVFCLTWISAAFVLEIRRSDGFSCAQMFPTC